MHVKTSCRKTRSSDNRKKTVKQSIAILLVVDNMIGKGGHETKNAIS